MFKASQTVPPRYTIQKTNILVLFMTGIIPPNSGLTSREMTQKLFKPNFMISHLEVFWNILIPVFNFYKFKMMFCLIVFKIVLLLNVKIFDKRYAL